MARYESMSSIISTVIGSEDSEPLSEFFFAFAFLASMEWGELNGDSMGLVYVLARIESN